MSTPKPQKKHKSAAFHTLRTLLVKGTASFPWPFCSKCGLVCLKNDATRAALAQRCDAMEEA